MKHLKNPLPFIEKTAWSILNAVARLIDGLFRLLFGRSAGLASKVPPLRTRAEDVIQAIRETAEPTAPDAYLAAHKPALALHQYVAAKDPAERALVDLTGFTDDQLDWLLSLSDEHLQKLATAGPEACERALTGKRCGIIDLPMPKPRVAASIYNVQGAGDLTYESRIARRIRAYKNDRGVPYPVAM